MQVSYAIVFAHIHRIPIRACSYNLRDMNTRTFRRSAYRYFRVKTSDISNRI